MAHDAGVRVTTQACVWACCKHEESLDVQVSSAEP
jgi:hypothetical protein